MNNNVEIVRGGGVEAGIDVAGAQVERTHKSGKVSAILAKAEMLATNQLEYLLRFLQIRIRGGGRVARDAIHK